jgi:hypothetical protein
MAGIDALPPLGSFAANLIKILAIGRGRTGRRYQSVGFRAGSLGPVRSFPVSRSHARRR